MCKKRTLFSLVVRSTCVRVGFGPPAMEPSPDDVVAGSDAGPGLDQVPIDEHNVGEHGSAERVGLNLSPYNTTLAGHSVQQPSGIDARAAPCVAQGTSSASSSIRTLLQGYRSVGRSGIPGLLGSPSALAQSSDIPVRSGQDAQSSTSLPPRSSMTGSSADLQAAMSSAAATAIPRPRLRPPRLRHQRSLTTTLRASA